MERGNQDDDGGDRRLRDRQIILDAVAEGIYGLDRQGRVTFANAAAEQLTGWPRDKQLGRRHHELIHHSYGDGTPYPLDECPIFATLRKRQVVHGEEIFWRRDGSKLPVAFTSSPVLDGEEAVGAVVTFSDLTVRHLERRYRALVSATSDFVWRCDATGALEEIDPEWLDLTGFTHAQVVGEGWVRAFHPDDRAPYLEVRDAAIAAGRDFEQEYRLLCADGEMRWFLNRTVPVRGANGSIIEWIGVAQEITARKARESQLEEQASRDRLTGLRNRWEFETRLQEEIESVRRLDGQFSLLLLDIDHFKAVNDRHGHEVGDGVLKALGEVLGDVVRSTDLLARWGGEEFVILLPGADIAGAGRVAEAARTRVAATRFPHGESTTISIGVAQYKDGDTGTTLFGRADRALYAAKEGGRDRIFLDDAEDRRRS